MLLECRTLFQYVSRPFLLIHLSLSAPPLRKLHLDCRGHHFGPLCSTSFTTSSSPANKFKMIATTSTMIHPSKTWQSIPTAKSDLRKRAIDGSICGWLGGQPELPALCAGASSCVRDTEHKYVGCCGTTGSCTAGIYTSCVDQNSPGWSPPPSIQTNGVYTCPKDKECYRNTFAEGYFQFGCGKSSWATRVETTYTGQPSDVVLPIVYTAVTFPMTQSTSSESPTMVTSDSSMNSTPANTPSPEESDDLDPGEVAGIIIGAVNAFVILCGLILCLWLRRRRHRRRRLLGETHNSSEREAAVRNVNPMQRLSAVSHIPNILQTPLRISPSLASYRSPHISRPNIPTSPISSKYSSQRVPLVGSDSERLDFNRDTSNMSELRSNRGTLSPRPEPQPRIGVAISNIPGLRGTSYSQLNTHNTENYDDDDPNTPEFHSVTGISTDSPRSRKSRPEDDIRSSVSLMSDQEESLSTASVRQVTHVRRGDNGRYHLVDQVVNSSKELDPRI